MKFPLIAIFAGAVYFTGANAQVQPSAPARPATSADTQLIIMLGGQGAQITTFGISGATVPYGSGKHPNLQQALLDLNDAQMELSRANSTDKGEYLSRAILGVQMAIADVKYTLDEDDGVPTPSESSLPRLPAGVGNASSGIKVLPVQNPGVSSPNMDAAIADLKKVQGEFNIAVHWTPPVFMARAVTDVGFALDNANAAVNLANGQPPPQAKEEPSPTPANPAANPPAVSISMAEIMGAVVVLTVLIAIAVEQVVRTKGKRGEG